VAPIASVSSARSASNADSAAIGSDAGRMARQIETSSIQVGISRSRALSAPVRPHRAQAPASRSITSWTRTERPAHGCQAYATVASAAVVLPWVLCRWFLQRRRLHSAIGFRSPIDMEQIAAAA